MIASIKSSVENHAARALAENLLFVLADQGKMTATGMRYYLANLKKLVETSYPNLQHAASVAERRGYPALSKYFIEKAEEEKGHGEWAREDMEKLPSVQMGPAEMSSGELPSSPSITELLSYHRHLIDEDPFLYVPYLFLAEYLTVLVGPTFMKNLTSKCGIPPECMSVVGNHAELDKDHVEEAIQFFTESVPVDYEKRFLEIIDRSVRYYEAFGREVADAQS